MSLPLNKINQKRTNFMLQSSLRAAYLRLSFLFFLLELWNNFDYFLQEDSTYDISDEESEYKQL